MIDEIVKFTNMYVVQLRTNRTYHRERDCKETTRSEFLDYLGVLYTKKSYYANVKEIWTNDGTGIEICRTVLSYKRFFIFDTLPEV